MGRSPPTEERAASRSLFTADITIRLQQLVTGWQGAERNQSLFDLHNECLNAAGPGGRHLLPAKLLLVKNLDETNLQAAIRNANGKGRGTIVRFRVKPLGRFDAALVPTGLAGAVPDCWLLAIPGNLSLPDPASLYRHALRHPLLNREQGKISQFPPPG